MTKNRLTEENKPARLPEPDYTCTQCDGTGMEHPLCEICLGVGWVDDDGGTMTCPECDAEPCSHCDGTGEEPEKSEDLTETNAQLFAAALDLMTGE